MRRRRTKRTDHKISRGKGAGGGEEEGVRETRKNRQARHVLRCGSQGKWKEKTGEKATTCLRRGKGRLKGLQEETGNTHPRNGIKKFPPSKTNKESCHNIGGAETILKAKQ